LKNHDEVHTKLYSGQDWKHGAQPTFDEWLPVSKYMGLLEGIGVLARNHLIDLQVTERLVSYRVGELVSDEYIRSVVETDPAWVEFRGFWRSLDEVRKQQKRPILCPGHEAPRR
jgi:hypothetical protein